MLKRHSNNYDFLKALKETTKCKDCNLAYPHYVMEFEHTIPRNGSTATISSLAQKLGLKALKLEIDKCDIVCANCHRIRTWNRKQRV